MNKCSFCRRPPEEIRVLIKARDGHAICEVCTRNARDVLNSFAADDVSEEPAPVAAPKVIDFATARGLILAKRGEL